MPGQTGLGPWCPLDAPHLLLGVWLEVLEATIR